jgi:hypothetical protein
VRHALLAYVVVVALIAGSMRLRSTNVRPTFPRKVEAMTWAEVKDGIVVPAKPPGTWTWAVDYVRGPALILLEASGRWSYASSRECGPDGDLNSLVRTETTLLPGAPLGALLAKVGGSTAGAGDGLVRVVGSRGMLQIDEKTSGPVFLTINDEPGGFIDNTGELKVKISIRKIETPPK